MITIKNPPEKRVSLETQFPFMNYPENFPSRKVIHKILCKICILSSDVNHNDDWLNLPLNSLKILINLSEPSLEACQDTVLVLV